MPSLEKTRVIKRPTAGADVDATRVVRAPEPVKKEEAKKEILKEKLEEKANQVKNAPEPEDEINTSEATEFINVGSLLPSIKDKAKQAEQEIITLARSEEHTSELQSRENLVCR